MKEERTVCTGLPQGVNLHKCANVKQAAPKIRLLHTQSVLSARYQLKKQNAIWGLWVFIINVLTIKCCFTLSSRVRSVFWDQMSTSSRPADSWRRIWSSHSHYRQALWHSTVTSHTDTAVIWQGGLCWSLYPHSCLLLTPSKSVTSKISMCIYICVFTVFCLIITKVLALH